MNPRNEERKFLEPQTPAAKPRFQIEQLEERIAPSKGGVHGKPDPPCRPRRPSCF
jgi:hypothetical protein